MTSLCKPEKNKINRNVVKTNDSDFELGNQMLRRIHSEIREMPPNRQIIIGVTSGWIFGMLAMKIGRSLALAVGGGLILLQIASDKGYISINWNAVNQNFKTNPDNVKTLHEFALDGQCQPISMPNWVKTLRNFAAENMSLTVGILGGFFIGLAS